jgi:site-specific DNA-methyltransferase (cytosine-N4-specific)
VAGSQEGSLVLDPFFGSGTVGDVCQLYGRRFLGIELNPEYVEIAEKRLKWR